MWKPIRSEAGLGKSKTDAAFISSMPTIKFLYEKLSKQPDASDKPFSA